MLPYPQGPRFPIGLASPGPVLKYSNPFPASVHTTAGFPSHFVCEINSRLSELGPLWSGPGVLHTGAQDWSLPRGQVSIVDRVTADHSSEHPGRGLKYRP